MWTFQSETSNERSKHLRFRQPHCHLSLPVYPANIRTDLILLKTRIIALHFAADNMGLFSFKILNFLVGSVKLFSARLRFGVQGHPRSLIMIRIESAYVTSY